MTRSNVIRVVSLLIGATALAAPAMAQFPGGASSLQNAINMNTTQALLLPKLEVRAAAGAIGALALSPDGKRLVSVPADKLVRVWDLENGLEARRLAGLGQVPTAVAVSGDAIAAADAGGARVWRLGEGGASRLLSGGRGQVSALAFTPDAKVLLVGWDSGDLIEWDVATGREGRRLTGHRDAVRGLAFDAAGAILVSGDASGAVFVWNFAEGRSTATISAERGVTAVAVSPDGTKLLTGDASGRVVFWQAGGTRIGRYTTHDDPITGLAFNAAGTRFASSSRDQLIIARDVKDPDKAIKFGGRDGAVVGIASDPRSGRWITANVDGMIRIWDQANQAMLARLISTTDGWAAIEQNGRFDGSAKAASEVSWAGSNGSVEIDRVSERYFQPGLLAMIMSSQAQVQAPAPAPAQASAPPPAQVSAPAPAPVQPQAQPQTQVVQAPPLPPPAPTATAAALKASVDKPPTVALVDPKDGAEVTTETIEVTVQVSETDGGGAEEVRLYHNGKLVVDKGARAAAVTVRGGGRRLLQSFEIQLAPGENVIKAVAFSAARVESAPAQAKLTLKAAQRKPVAHVLVVGINEYKNPALNLNYGVSDAKGIMDFFSGPRMSLFQEVKRTSLFNADATKGRILEAIRTLRATAPEDMAVVYLAGHGETTEDGSWYFVPHDVTFPERQQQLMDLGLSSKQLQEEIAQIGARKVVVLLDACKSGGALVAFRGFEERKAILQLARSTGVHVVAAAAQDQFAGEVASLKHGIFTYTVLQALGGAADGSPKDHIVSVREMLSYVENEMPEISQKERSKAQFPVVDSRGMDFPVALTE